MKSFAISLILILLYVGLSFWSLSNLISKKDYINYIKVSKTANETIIDLEEFLLEFPKMKTKEDVEKYWGSRPAINDTSFEPPQELIPAEGDETLRFENLRVKLNEKKEIDSIVIVDYFNATLKQVLLPRISNIELIWEPESYYYFRTHFLWQILIVIFVIIIIITTAYCKITKKKLTQNSVIVFLMSILLLNFIHLGFYQLTEFYYLATDITYESFGKSNLIVPSRIILNEFADHSHKFADVFDVSIICIVFLSVILFKRLKQRSITL